MLCKCGCGQEIKSNSKQEYIYGHRTKAAQSNELIPCACGCGQMKKKFDKSGQLAPIYLKGHNPSSISALPHGYGPDNNFFGKKHSEENKQAHSTFMKQWLQENKNPFKGKHHSEETKQAISIANKGRKCPPRTEEHRRKLSKANQRNKKQHSENTKRLWQDPKYRNKVIDSTTGLIRGPEARANISKGRKAVGNPSGFKASNWQGGKSFEPYSTQFTQKLREEVRQRDNETCQLCGLTSKGQEQALDVHHWDYDKNREDPYYFISLCHSCHSKTQGKSVRDYYENLFRQIMQERFPDHI